MTASTPHVAEIPSVEDRPSAATVQVLLTVVEGADLDAAIAVVQRQVYDPAPEVVIVGGDAPEGMARYESLEMAIAGADEKVDYLWLLHSDARPRPDALAALVREIERNEASLGGSKLLVAGSMDELEEVGSATDVFGEPYSGLEQGEIDLQQYDVVREVAFVRSASMLARRDLAQGLRGLDELLPPIAAGLDFSQRTRLAGGKVISVPSSEVYHQGRCNPRSAGWREQAGRLRAMLTAYKPLTLAWVVPYDFLVAILDSLANLLLLRWRPAVWHAMSWMWNLVHLPSTIRRRSRLKKVRVAGDEELFRFQARGSVRLREVGIELSARALSMFDDDETLAKRSRRFLGSPGIWGALLGTALALIAARSFIFSGMPDSGFSFPFETPAISIDRWFAGWNSSGLGSPYPVHPSGLMTAIVSVLAFGSLGAARTIFTVLLAVVAVGGMGRLGGRLGLRGPGRYLAGIVLIAGPGTAALSGRGSWLALCAAAFLPWMVRAVLLLPDLDPKPLRPLGWTLMLGTVVAAFSPLLVGVPLLMALAVPGAGARSLRLRNGVVGLASGLIAVPFLLGDRGWLLDASRRLFVFPTSIWPVLIGVGLLPLLLLGNPWRRIATVGAIGSLVSLFLLRFPVGGPGLEEALLIIASFGAALVASAGLDRLGREPIRVLAALAAVAIIAVSYGPFANGRYGLPSGQVNDDFGFAAVLAGETGAGRVLVASPNRTDIPGEARTGPGFWYRLIEAPGVTHDQIWLPPARDGDTDLREALDAIASGQDIRPGHTLGDFAIDWVVLLGADFALDRAFGNQVDMARRMFDPEMRVFENEDPKPLAGSDAVVWDRDGAGFSGPAATDGVRIAANYDPSWRPFPEADGWAMIVDGSGGEASFRRGWVHRILALSGVLVALGGMAMVVRARVRR